LTLVLHITRQLYFAVEDFGSDAILRAGASLLQGSVYVLGEPPVAQFSFKEHDRNYPGWRTRSGRMFDAPYLSEE
jgi:hypothetical protein